MNKELEVTFANVDHNDLRKKIQNLGAQCIQPRYLMKRVVFKNPDNPDNSFFRLRDEGNKITFTYKDISKENKGIDGVSELETVVEDFDTMKQILTLSGLQIKAYQETYRETWKTDEGVFFMLDQWPGLKPFIEIEADSEKLIRSYSDSLEFDFNTGIFGTIDELYFLELGIPHKVINSTPEITFQNPPQKYR